mmetsp:Transcript_24559/g.58372  ORF Transcript_24559/g.58372 Transcript_24559/m.58372 type:complete len:218 (+) Transcript_24559:2644-3297(+)
MDAPSCSARLLSARCRRRGSPSGRGSRVANPRRQATETAACMLERSTESISASSATVMFSLAATKIWCRSCSRGSAFDPTESLLETNPSRWGIVTASSGRMGTSMYRSPRLKRLLTTAASSPATWFPPGWQAACRVLSSSGVSARYSISPMLTTETCHHGSNGVSTGSSGRNSRAIPLLTRQRSFLALHWFRISMYSFLPMPSSRIISAAVKFGIWS